MKEIEAKYNGLKWLENNAAGLNKAAVENYQAEVTSIVMAETNEDDTEETEREVAYVVNYNPDMADNKIRRWKVHEKENQCQTVEEVFLWILPVLPIRLS